MDGILYGSYKNSDVSLVPSERIFDISLWDTSNPIDNLNSFRSSTYEICTKEDQIYIFIPYGKFNNDSRYTTKCFIAKEYASNKITYKRQTLYSVFGIVSKTYPYAVFRVKIKDSGKDTWPEHVFFTVAGKDK